MTVKSGSPPQLHYHKTSEFEYASFTFTQILYFLPSFNTGIFSKLIDIEPNG